MTTLETRSTLIFRGSDFTPVGVFGRRARFYEQAIKPLLDRVLALVLIVVTSPLWICAAVAILATSRGPVIYTQTRLGLGGRRFTIFKLRSMYQDSETGTGPRWCIPGDPRVTPVGWILRKTHIDELPQLWNVLRGDLSLVGPRPERPEIAMDICRSVPDFDDRLLVKPGLTGLAQVQQPPDQTYDCARRKLEKDLIYIDQMSLWLDARIAIATVLHLACVPSVWIARLCLLPTRELWREPKSEQEHETRELVLEASN